LNSGVSQIDSSSSSDPTGYETNETLICFGDENCALSRGSRFDRRQIGRGDLHAGPERIVQTALMLLQLYDRGDQLRAIRRRRLTDRGGEDFVPSHREL
jgi:hypothetical protein